MNDRRCPDNGFCHHNCPSSPTECFRVKYCEPLSDVFPNDEWPADIRRNDMPTLQQATARGARVTVVAAVTERGIVRGVSHHTPLSEIVTAVQQVVGMLDPDIEWSTATYQIPSYFTLLADGMSAWDIPGGVFLFPWDPTYTKDWKNPDRRFALTTPELIYRPRGWATGRRSTVEEAVAGA